MPTIDQAFIKQFEREVHEAFQRQGSKLRNTVRTINNVKGSSAIFQKVGKGTAATKVQHGMVPVMNLDHTNVECILQDYYAGDWIDHLDELKTNIDERQVIANAGAHALGRKSDEMIITALEGAATNVITDGNVGLTKDKVLNENGLRNDKEFVNHKILDLAGDFLLSGHRILGKVVCYHGGHELTNLFLRKIFATKSAFQIFELKDFKFSKKIQSKEFEKIAVNA